jgi:hypothetical protein
MMVMSKLALAALLLIATSALPQSATRDSLFEAAQREHWEAPEDEYVRLPRAERKISPGHRFSSSEIFTVQVNVNELGENLIGDAANEPTLAIDPRNPNRMVIGWRQFDTINSNFRQAGYGFTQDRGDTWIFPGVIEPGVFRSDPVLDSDAEGNFYFNSLTVRGSDFICHVFKSSDGGSTWDAGTFAQGGDKQWMVIDKTDGIGRGNIYAYWTQAFSVCAPGFFTRSTNRGLSFENCVIIPDETMRWGTLALGPEGELYACGESDNGFVVTRSLSARDSSQAVTWDLSTIVDLDGAMGFGGGPNPGGLLGQTWVAIDRSAGPLRGNVYLLCSVNRFSTRDPLDVMFARSTDGGETWSEPVRVNDDTTENAWQWFGTMSVAPNGRIDVIWLDTRDDPGGYRSSLYYSHSWDGGVTWSANERLSEAFDPHVGWPRQSKLGDYFHMISEDAHAHLAWAGTFNGEQDVYYSRISPPISAVREHQPGSARVPQSATLAQNYPNPFNPATTIDYVLAQRGEVQLKILNDVGAEVKVLVRATQAAGRHLVVWDGRNEAGERLASGAYFYTLTVGGREVISKRMLLLK